LRLLLLDVPASRDLQRQLLVGRAELINYIYVLTDQLIARSPSSIGKAYAGFADSIAQSHDIRPWHDCEAKQRRPLADLNLSKSGSAALRLSAPAIHPQCFIRMISR